MKIFSGKLELFESGVAQTAFENSLIFDFDEIRIDIEFKTDKNKKDKDSEFSLKEDPERLILTLFNFNNSDPSGMVRPVEIGEFNSRELFFNYRAYRISSNVSADSWIMHYFFYLGDVVNG